MLHETLHRWMKRQQIVIPVLDEGNTFYCLFQIWN